ncbi:DUF6767 domain-containing protein [Propionimicrobium sp. PCR01-08-3]|uniref:DUF6767 domain-containing protein n=1 Tax=Propionimicrobium sp. PCR01-08-3 TaxID=3052086 RepID=UPI00255CE311|nr:DUF6767 domain-containing protein [Propionimicrobium sp. PCR01-08-3]WIY81408.1 hypothetical protein QQ658_07560 [Propionimicrobium sp. PCR01-08-3]
MKNARLTTPRCPLRPDDPCSLCQPGANGPQDCGLVYLVMDDPELRAVYAAKLKERRSVHDAADEHCSTSM